MSFPETASHSIIIPRSIHVAASDIYFILSKAEYYSTVYLYHMFFIHSSVNGYLGYFHALAIVNSAAMNFRVHVSFRIRVFLGYTPRSGIAGSYGNSVFSSEENSILFSLVAAPAYIPTDSVGGFPFSPHFLEEETFTLDPETICKEGYFMGYKI